MWGEGGGKGGAKAKGVMKGTGKNMECVALRSRYVTKCELHNIKTSRPTLKLSREALRREEKL